MTHVEVSEHRPLDTTGIKPLCNTVDVLHSAHRHDRTEQCWCVLLSHIAMARRGLALAVMAFIAACNGAENKAGPATLCATLQPVLRDVVEKVSLHFNVSWSAAV